MTPQKAAASLLCAAAALLAQSCVEYVPAEGYAPPAQQPPYPAQVAAQPPGPPQPPEAPPPGPDDALVAPIALYPDPLIALILPASTVPGDVSAAASYLVQYGDMTRLDAQPWDPSVRGLAHYPTVVTWMAQNMPWTRALGSAFLASPGSVMDAVQRLRARAVAAGTLTSTPQQEVYSDNGQIDIYPAQADALYVPVYDDAAVYSEGPYAGFGGPFITFGEPYAEGDWLSFYFDWSGHRVWSGGRNVWRQNGGWRPPHSGGGRSPPGAHAWRPPTGAPRAPLASSNAGPAPHPGPMPGAPRPAPRQYGRPAGQSVPVQNMPAPRTAAPPAVRPQLGNAAAVPGAYNRPSERLQAPPPPHPYSAQPARAGSPAPAPREAPARESAPAPAQDNGKQQPQK